MPILLLLAGSGAVAFLPILVQLVVALLIFWLFYYVINAFAPEPIRRVLNVVLIVIAVIYLIYFLIGLTPMLS